MRAVFDAGYVYELTGLLYYGFFLVLMRRRDSRYSRRTQVLIIAAAIALVGAGLFGYAAFPLAVGVMIALAAAGVVSAYVDVRQP